MYVKIDWCTVLYTADGMVFHHAHFLNASLRRLKRKEVQFRICSLARTPVDKRHHVSVSEYITTADFLTLF